MKGVSVCFYSQGVARQRGKRQDLNTTIVAFLSLIALFFSTVFPVSVHLLFGVPLASGAWDILFAVAFIAYFLGCFLSCLQFLRGVALVGVAVGIHVLVAFVLVIDFTWSHGAYIGAILFPLWLLFVVLYGLTVIHRLREITPSKSQIDGQAERSGKERIGTIAKRESLSDLGGRSGW